MKINFTKEHYTRMSELLLDMLMCNQTITNKLGQPLNVVELLHTTTINTLNGIRLSLTRQIDNLENQDEWVSSSETQNKLENLKASKELVNLIIGFKRYLQESHEIEEKRNALKSKIAAMKEEAKTPEEKLKEAEAELAALDSPNF